MLHKISVLKTAKQDFFNIAEVVLGLKLPGFTNYCSRFTVIRVLFSLALSTIKVWIIWKATMILFFNAVYSSFKGFKCGIQILQDPKNSWKFFRPRKIAEILWIPKK